MSSGGGSFTPTSQFGFNSDATKSNSDAYLRPNNGSFSKSDINGNMSGTSPIQLAETGRRPSGNFSRMSFLYNNTFLSGNSSNMSTSNGSNQNSNVSLASPTTKSYYNSNSINMTGTSFQQKDPLDVPTTNERIYFHSTGEILACDRSYEIPNLIAIATPRNLQLLKVSDNEISLQTELQMKQSGRSKFGTVSDLRFGHQNYGRYLAASTITGSIHVYNFDRGNRPKTTLFGHQRAVNSIDFNHITPHLLASGSQDGKILIWDMKASNTKPAMTLNCNADAVRCCSFSPKKGHILAAVFDSGVVEKWDLRKNTTWERRINAHTGPALSVHWHPELDYIVTGGRDKQLQVWNLAPGVDSRDPSHVINTPNPISKAKWCKGRGNGSILNTDIAVSFFNDDSCIQIWNLNRKFIPKTIIEGHSAQITQIVWRTPKQLISCSRDKTLIQYDVTKEPDYLGNIPNGAFAWNPSNKIDFTYIKQTKSQFNGPFTSTVSRPVYTADSNVSEDSASFHNLSGAINMVSSGNNIGVNGNGHTSNAISMLSQSESSMQFYEMAGTSPGKHSPVLGSTMTQQKQRQPLPPRQPSYSKTLPKQTAPPAWITSVHIPLVSNDQDKFKYLSTYYLVSIPEGSDICEVCEYNSILAASVGFYRDSQTWKTIQMAMVLEIEKKHGEEINDKLNHFHFDNKSFSRSDSRLGTSFGSESDVIKHRGSDISGSYTSEYQLQPVEITHENTNNDKTSEHKFLNKNYNESAIDDEEGYYQEENKDANTTAKSIKTILGDSTDVDLEKEDKDLSEVSTEQDSENQTYDNKLPVGMPIDIDSRIRKKRNSLVKNYRYSFTGSSVDLDDEKAGSPLSLSGSPIIPRSRSKLLLSMSAKTTAIGGNAEDAQFTSGTNHSFDTRTSMKSHLTAIMQSGHTSPMKPIFQPAEETVEECAVKGADSLNDSSDLRVPWNPEDLIRQAAEYSLEQGDILMCATLALLFEKLYPNAIDNKRAEEWIYTYHEMLLRGCYFNNAATILKIASESHECFKSLGQIKTSIKTMCIHCGKPVLNDNSKENYKASLAAAAAMATNSDSSLENVASPRKLEFGFWYCDRCNKLQGGCCYCNEPIKGNTVGLIGCGHQGHFGCFRTWFIDQKQVECPACGVLCIK